MDTTIETVRNTAALEAIRSVLETHVLFNVLPTAEKRAIELLLEVRQVPAGKKLFNQGAAADGMYVIHDGSARLKENTGGKLVSVGLIGDRRHDRPDFPAGGDEVAVSGRGRNGHDHGLPARRPGAAAGQRKQDRR